MMCDFSSHPFDLLAWDNYNPFQSENHSEQEKENLEEESTGLWDLNWVPRDSSEELIKRGLADLEQLRDFLASEEPPRIEPEYEVVKKCHLPLVTSLLQEPDMMLMKSPPIEIGSQKKQIKKISPKIIKKKEKENRTPPMSGRKEKKSKRIRFRNTKREQSEEKEDPKVSEKIMKLLKEAKKEEQNLYAAFGGSS